MFFNIKERGDYKFYMIKKVILINVIGLWEGVLILVFRLNLNLIIEYVY